MPENQRCILCGLSTNDLMTIENNSVCAECKPIYLQGLKEGKFANKNPSVYQSSQRARGIGIGIAITLVLQVLGGIVWFAWFATGIHGYLPLNFLALWGATQLIYMVPAIIVSAALRKKGIMIGMIIVTVSIFIMNAGCVGMLMLNSGLTFG